jgi:hypothetical protein
VGRIRLDVTFTYSAGPNADQTVVDCYCGTTVYMRCDGLSGISAPGVRTLTSRVVKNGSGVLESETDLATIRGDPSDAVPGVNVWSDPAVYRALL